MADWTPERDKQLRALWEDEGLSTNEIGARMGCGKNAVVGRAHRIGLAKRESPIRRSVVVMTGEQRATMTTLIHKGHTRDQVAHIMGVGRDLVMREAKGLVAPRVRAVSMSSAAAVARARAATNSIGAAEGFRTRGAEGGGSLSGGFGPAANPVPAVVAGDPGPGGSPGGALRRLPCSASDAVPSSATLPPALVMAPAVLSRRTCRWPMWSITERPTHLYCDAAVCRGSYCAEHAKRAYTLAVERDPNHQVTRSTFAWGGKAA